MSCDVKYECSVHEAIEDKKKSKSVRDGFNNAALMHWLSRLLLCNF